jgi:hypothetical protein
MPGPIDPRGLDEIITQPIDAPAEVAAATAAA